MLIKLFFRTWRGAIGVLVWTVSQIIIALVGMFPFPLISPESMWVWIIGSLMLAFVFENLVFTKTRR